MPHATGGSLAGGLKLTYETVPRCEAMLNRLTHWWWSPHPPSHYTYKVGEAVRGIGTVAYQLPAEFNLAWARDSKLLLKPEMEKYVLAGVNLSSLNMHHTVEGMAVQDWVTLCKPEHLLPVFTHTTELPKLAKSQLVSALRSAVKLRAV